MFIPSRATRGENRLRSILALRGDDTDFLKKQQPCPPSLRGGGRETQTPANDNTYAMGGSPRNARIDLNFSPRVAWDGMNIVSFIARRPEGVRS